MRPDRDAGDRRAQASLPALALALLILTSVTVLSLAVADGVLASADREPRDRHVASSLADRLVAADGPVAARTNVLREAELAALNASSLPRLFPVTDGAAVSVTVGDRRIVEDSDARDGTTVRRIVTVRRTDRRSITPPFGGPKAVTLPRRTGTATIALDPPANTTIRSVRANARVLLEDPSGLDGQYDVELSRFETARLHFAGPGPLYRGNVTVAYPVERTNREVLQVTVDA